VKDLTSAAIWPLLSQAALWPTYYNNASKIGFDGEAGPELSLGARFRFTTFGLDVEAQVTECASGCRGTGAHRLARVGRRYGRACARRVARLARRGHAR
jgi:hypothetical protein